MLVPFPVPAVPFLGSRAPLAPAFLATFYIGADNDTGAPIGEATVARILKMHGFDGATILPARGLWAGGSEGSTVVYVVTDATDERARAVADAAGSLRGAHDQTEVLYTLAPIFRGAAHA